MFGFTGRKWTDWLFIVETIQVWYLKLCSIECSNSHCSNGRREKEKGPKMESPLNLKNVYWTFFSFIFFCEYFIENSFQQNIEILIDYGPLNIWFMLKIKYAFYASFQVMQTEFQTFFFYLSVCIHFLFVCSFIVKKCFPFDWIDNDAKKEVRENVVKLISDKFLSHSICFRLYVPRLSLFSSCVQFGSLYSYRKLSILLCNSDKP